MDEFSEAELNQLCEDLHVAEDILCDVWQFLEGEPDFKNAGPVLLVFIRGYFDAKHKRLDAASRPSCHDGSQ
jgi:hypothetical protein